MLTNSPSAEYTFRLEQRKSFSFRMRFINQAGGPLDLTLHQVSMVVKSEYSATATTIFDIQAAIEDPQNGYVRFDIQADDLTAHAPAEYPYAITLLTPEGYTVLVMKGYVEMVSNTESLWVDEEYSTVNAPVLLNVLFGQGNRITVQTPHYPAPSLSAAPVVELPAGSAPTARFVGRYPYQILELGIPVVDETIQPEILVLPESELVPLGTDPGTVIYRLPEKHETLKVTHFSNNTGQPISDEFELPDDVRIGDVLMATVAGRAGGTSVTWAAPWEEKIDLSQSQTISMAIYRVVDQAALDALVKPSVDPVANFNFGVLTIQKIRAITSAWPAYGSGNGRSAQTLLNISNSGFEINQIGTSPFGAYDTNYAYASAYSGIAQGPAPEIATPAGFEEIVNTSTGGYRFAMWRRFPSPVMPVPLVPVSVTHDPALANSNYGGCQFVVPTA